MIIIPGNYLYDDISGKAYDSIRLVKFGDPSPLASYLSDSNPTKVVITSASAIRSQQHSAGMSSSLI